MQNFNLNELVAKALDEMEQHGATAKQLYVYRTTGFGSALRYFSKKGVSNVDAEMLDAYLRIMHSGYLQGEYSEWKWRLVRRGKEILSLFMEQGCFGLKPLRPWDHKLGKSRQSIIYDKPLESQFREPLNLFVIVWKIRNLLVEAGYTQNSIRHYTSEGLTVILRKHYEAGTEIYSESLIKDIVLSKRTDYENGQTSRQSYQNLRKAAFLINTFVKTGVLDLERVPSFNKHCLCDVFDKKLNDFCSLMIKESRLKSSSVRTLKSAVRNFLFGLENMEIYSFQTLTPLDVSRCITIISKKYPCGAGTLLFAAQKFLRYLYETNITDTDLSNTLPKTFSVKNTFHEPFTADELQLLFSLPKRNTITGNRDYAIMLLAVKTGLRACDIVALKRENIDWRRKQINIIQQKTGAAISLPLSVDVGNVIAEYLLKYRPDSVLPQIFLCESRTVRPFDSRSASAMFTRYMKLAGIHDPAKRRGFHSLRRTFAASLLDNEIPMDLIRQFLGHTHINSMKPYLSVNENGLKQCALSISCIYEKEASL